MKLDDVARYWYSIVLIYYQTVSFLWSNWTFKFVKFHIYW